MPFRYLCPGCHRKQAMPGRCPECKREREHSRGTRQQRGYTDHWLRLVQLAIRTQPYCSNPDCRSTEDLTGDHIVPLSMGGTNTLENVQVLCRSCNSRKGTGAALPSPNARARNHG
jgi:5-methylcytosine-specific restriction protein A